MLSAKDKIIKSKVLLQKNYPFFAYLTLHLKQKEKDGLGTVGVDAFNNLYYDKAFVEKLTQEETTIVLCHEVLHIALNHLTRKGKRDSRLWNICCDLIANKILEQNFHDFDKTIIYKDGITEDSLQRLFGIRIENVEKRFVEEVYDILEKHLKSNKKFKSFVSGYGFDKHFDLDGLSEKEKKELEKKYGKSFGEIKKEIENEIRRKLVEANSFAKLRGKSPLGMERIFDKLLQSKLNWKAILRKTISDNIPYDFSYKFPSRKSIAVGTYLPTTLKDKKLKCACVVDLSGSVSEEEMREFLTEVYSIVKSFRNVEMYLITHDFVPQGFYEIKNGCLDKLLGIKLKGGGGTSHTWLKKYLKEKQELRNVKIIVCFTDGYSDIEELEKEDFVGKEFIWIITKGGKADGISFGKVIKL